MKVRLLDLPDHRLHLLFGRCSPRISCSDEHTAADRRAKEIFEMPGVHRRNVHSADEQLHERSGRAGNERGKPRRDCIGWLIVTILLGASLRRAWK